MDFSTYVKLNKPSNVNEALGGYIKILYEEVNQSYLDRIITQINKKKYLLIDLGNIHNALQYIDSFDEFDEFDIIAFADYMFNGYGINPPSIKSAVVVADRSKNAADVSIIWHVSRICQTNENEIHIITKDKGFQSLSRLAANEGTCLYFYETFEKFNEKRLLSIPF